MSAAVRLPVMNSMVASQGQVTHWIKMNSCFGIAASRIVVEITVNSDLSYKV